MTDFIYRGVFILLILKLFMTMYQRKFNETGTIKRLVSLYQSMIIGVLYLSISIIKARVLSENFIYVSLLLFIVILVLFRKILFPYHSICEKCHKKLKISQILFIDSQKCSICENIH